MICGLARTHQIFAAFNLEGMAAGRYAPFNIANLMAIQQRERILATILAKGGLSDLSGLEILDVGCGSGGLFLRLMSWGASPDSLHGIDLQADRVLRARSIHPKIEVVEGNAAALPWAGERFDMVMQFTTFTSIPDDAVRAQAAGEIDRVLKPGGRVLWYDFWINPVNRETHPIQKRELNKLFPGYRLDIRRTTLAPPIARQVVPRNQLVASLLERLWLLQSHLIGLLTKPDGSRPTRFKYEAECL
jgi:ubiquinone/menaquinone biosynthesis C-methylase UbiE